MATIAAIQEALISKKAKAIKATVQEALNEGIDASDLFNEAMTMPWTSDASDFAGLSSFCPTCWWPREMLFKTAS